MSQATLHRAWIFRRRSVSGYTAPCMVHRYFLDPHPYDEDGSRFLEKNKAMLPRLMNGT